MMEKLKGGSCGTLRSVCNPTPGDDLVNSSAQQLYNLSAEISKLAESIDINTAEKLGPIMRPFEEEERQKDFSDGSIWPAYFEAMKESLLKIRACLNSINRTIEHVDL